MIFGLGEHTQVQPLVRKGEWFVDMGCEIGGSSPAALVRMNVEHILVDCDVSSDDLSEIYLRGVATQNMNRVSGR